MRFADDLARVERELDLPYPEKARLLDELAADLDRAYQVQRERGLSEDDACAAARRDLALDPQVLADLADIHRPAARRALALLPEPARDGLEWIAATAALAVLLGLLSTEVPLTMFLREGGGVIYAVVAVGVLGLLLQFHRVFLWFVLRDHSAEALRKNTPTPLYLAAATLCLAVLTTALDYYVVFFRWSEGEVNPVAVRDFAQGMREPLSCLIVGAGLASLIVLIHSAIQTGLRAIRIPQR